MSIEQIAQITTILSSVLTALALLIVIIVLFVRLVKKAQRADSEGGKEITPNEWKEIITKLLPFAVKLVDLVFKNQEQKEPVEKSKAEVKGEEKPQDTPIHY